MLIEQISYNINWKTFKTGTSFFIPCLNCTKAREELDIVAKRLNLDILTKICVEDGIKGLRVWKL